jgi:hypothetical protein
VEISPEAAGEAAWGGDFGAPEEKVIERDCCKGLEDVVGRDNIQAETTELKEIKRANMKWIILIVCIVCVCS